ncbi:MAG: hypothetical protein HY660_05400 [Armatimonadetes bacterium]|nr:hypothetical protein [Armatimonadota bacterium]
MRNTVNLLVVLSLTAAIGFGAAGGVAAQGSETVAIAQGADIETGDPHASFSIHTQNVLINLYDQLIARDASLRLKPGLALSWRIVDPTTWEFDLRRGVVFHNGEPFNAQAVKFSFERMLDPTARLRLAQFFKLVKGVTVVDDYRVRIHTERPWPMLAATVGRYGFIVPPRYVAQNGPQALVRQPVGTGPYRFVRWVKDSRVELEANNRYWGGAPSIKRVVVKIVASESSRLAELLSGSSHLINLIPPEVFGPISRSRNAKLAPADSASIFFVLLNLVNLPKERPLADRRVRQALNYAVDRDAMIKSIMHGIGDPVGTFCTAASVGCDASVTPFPHSPERARALLREAGYAGGFDMTVATPSGAYPGDRDLTLAVADQLNRVGVRAAVHVDDYAVNLRMVIEKKLPQEATFIRITDHVGYAAVIGFSGFHSTRGIVPLWVPGNREFERLLETAEETLDDARAKDLYRRAQLLFREEAPAIPLFTAPNVYGLHRDLEWTPRRDFLLTMFDATWKRR